MELILLIVTNTDEDVLFYKISNKDETLKTKNETINIKIGSGVIIDRTDKNIRDIRTNTKINYTITIPFN